jgi:hypothetical protein
MPFWRGVPPKSINAININSINAINVGLVTTLILVVLFIIGIVIAFAKVETQAPTAHTERMHESPLYARFLARGQLSILWRSHGGHEPRVQGRIPEGRAGRAGENASSDQPGSI